MQETQTWNQTQKDEKMAPRRPIHSGTGFKNEISILLRTKNGVEVL